MPSKLKSTTLLLASIAAMLLPSSRFAQAQNGIDSEISGIDFFSPPEELPPTKASVQSPSTSHWTQNTTPADRTGSQEKQKVRRENTPANSNWSSPYLRSSAKRAQGKQMPARYGTNDFDPYTRGQNSPVKKSIARQWQPPTDSPATDYFGESEIGEHSTGEALIGSYDSLFEQPEYGSTIKTASGIETPKTKKSPAKSQVPHILTGADKFTLAAEPKLGDHFRDDRPITDPRAHQIETLHHDFSPGPNYDTLPYQPSDQQNVYAGKKLYANQRPLLELGRPWYQLGQLSPGVTWFGKHNTITPQFLVYGDHRTAFASNNAGGDGTTLFASELNLDFDLKLTGTERFHAFMSPLDNGLTNTRYEFDDENFVSELDANIDFGYFEGDLGAMVGGLMGETMPFDFPFAVGVMPLLIQNGVWFEDAFLGVAATIPARNSARFNISNMDVTFFAGYDKVSSGAFPGDDAAAKMYGMASFIEAMNGYFEIDYAFLDDRTFDDRSYHNFGFAFTRRYGRLVSNSTRIIVNAGQSSDVVANTADGVLLLSENSLITGAPSTLVPYFNFFAGFDRPQSAARAVQAGGVLRNTGILFESDGMTGYPTLDPTANDTYGAALGLNIIADDFSQQLVLEMAALGVMGNDLTRNAPGQQYGLGFRYQLPLSNSIIFRADGMYGFLDNAEDISGIRMELRQKW